MSAMENKMTFHVRRGKYNDIPCQEKEEDKMIFHIRRGK
jgi:hypothetical protein